MIVFIIVLILMGIIFYINNKKILSVIKQEGYKGIDNWDLCENPENHDLPSVYFNENGEIKSETIQGKDRRNLTKCKIEKCKRVEKCTDLRNGLDNETVDYCGSCHINKVGEYNKYFYSNPDLETIRNNMIEKGMTSADDTKAGFDPYFNCITDKTFDETIAPNFKNWLPPKLFEKQSNPELECDNRMKTQMKILSNNTSIDAPSDLGVPGANCYMIKEVHDNLLSEGETSATQLANNIKNTVGWCGDMAPGNHGNHVIIDTDPETGEQLSDENGNLKLKSMGSQKCLQGKIWDMNTCRDALKTNPCLGDPKNPSTLCKKTLWKHGGINIAEEGPRPGQARCTTDSSVVFSEKTSSGLKNRETLRKLIDWENDANNARKNLFPHSLDELKHGFKKFMDIVVNADKDEKYSMGSGVAGRRGDGAEVYKARKLCSGDDFVVKNGKESFVGTSFVGTSFVGKAVVEEPFGPFNSSFVKDIMNDAKKGFQSLQAGNSSSGEKSISEVDPCLAKYDSISDLSDKEKAQYYGDCAQQRFTDRTGSVMNRNLCTSKGNIWNKLDRSSADNSNLSWKEMHSIINPGEQIKGDFNKWKDDVMAKSLRLSGIIRGEETPSMNYLKGKAVYDCQDNSIKIPVIKNGYISSNVGKFPDLRAEDLNPNIIPQKGQDVEARVGNLKLTGIVSNSNINNETVKIFITGINGEIRQTKLSYDKIKNEDKKRIFMKNQARFGWPEMEGTVFSENNINSDLPWSSLILLYQCSKSECCGNSCLEKFTRRVGMYPPMPSNCVYENEWIYDRERKISDQVSSKHSQAYYLIEKRPTNGSLKRERERKKDRMNGNNNLNYMDTAGAGCFKKQLRIYQPIIEQGDTNDVTLEITEGTKQKSLQKTDHEYKLMDAKLDGVAAHIFGKSNVFIPERIEKSGNVLDGTKFREGKIYEQFSNRVDEGFVEGNGEYILNDHKMCIGKGAIDLGITNTSRECANKCHQEKINQKESQEICCQWEPNNKKCSYVSDTLTRNFPYSLKNMSKSYMASMISGTKINSSNNYNIKTMYFFQHQPTSLSKSSALIEQNGKNTLNLVWHDWPRKWKKSYTVLFTRNDPGRGDVNGRISTKYYSGPKQTSGEICTNHKFDNSKAEADRYGWWLYCANNESSKHYNNVPRGVEGGDFLLNNPGYLTRLSYNNNNNGSNSLNTFKIFKGDNGKEGAAKDGLPWNSHDFLIEIRRNGNKVSESEKKKFLSSNNMFKNYNSQNTDKIEMFFRLDTPSEHWGLMNMRPLQKHYYVSINFLEMDFLVNN